MLGWLCQPGRLPEVGGWQELTAAAVALKPGTDMASHSMVQGAFVTKATQFTPAVHGRCEAGTASDHSSVSERKAWLGCSVAICASDTLGP